MVFLNSTVFAALKSRRLFHSKLPMSALLLCSSHAAKREFGKQNLLYVFKLAVVCIAQRRSLTCAATTVSDVKYHNKDTLSSCPSVNRLFKTKLHGMCSLQSQNSDIIFERYKSYYSSGARKYYRDAIFVLGPMGSGKTTIINKRLQRHNIYRNYAYVDTDEIMEKLPGFNIKQINIFYPEARQIAIRLTDWLLENQFSFVAEGTCVMYQELLDYMIRLKRTGYTIKVCTSPREELDVILQRTANREKRKIDVETVKDIYMQSTFGIQELYRINEENTIFEKIDIEKL